MFFVLAVCALSATAYADAAGDALRFLDHGKELFDVGQYEAAREAFIKSRDLAPDKPNPHRWTGLVDEKLGKCDEALHEFDIFLSMVGTTDPRSKDVIEARARCQAKVANPQYVEGLKRYNLGEYTKALEEFKAAYLASADPALLFNIGQCHRQLHQFEDAAKSFRAFLRESENVPPAQREHVQKLISEMETAVKEATTHQAPQPAEQAPKAEAPPQPGRIQISSEPSGALVRLDSSEGNGIGETPYEAQGVISGKHTVYVTRSGYEPKNVDVDVEPNGVTRVHLTLTPVAAAPVVETGAPVEQPRSRRKLAIIGGVIAGVVVVGVALGVGLGIGLSQPPSPSLGSLTLTERTK